MADDVVPMQQSRPRGLKRPYWRRTLSRSVRVRRNPWLARVLMTAQSGPIDIAACMVCTAHKGFFAITS
jgi:hypothetical protein